MSAPDSRNAPCPATQGRFQDLSCLRQDAQRIFQAALAAVEAGQAVHRHCRLSADGTQLILGPYRIALNACGRIFVVGAGKATAAMAAAMEEILGARIHAGHIVVKYGHTHPLQRMVLSQAGHPLPDANGLEAAQNILELARQAQAGDLVLVLLSGGGSALLPLPCPGLTLKDKQATMRVLLGCGATIHEINALRKHMSMIKGGRLAQAAYPAQVLALVLSDVVGDDLDTIASGPTVADRSTFAECRAIVERYRAAARLPAAVLRHIAAGCAGQIQESPKPGDAVLALSRCVVVGSALQALEAGLETARGLGYHSMILSSRIEGDTAETAHLHAAIAREIACSGHPLAPPACLLSGGETTVVVTGDGLGGRNQAFALSLVPQLAGEHPMVALCAGSDGSDGPTEAAGAITDNRAQERAARLGLDPAEFQRRSDSYHFFKALDDLAITGPTDTNVMDLRILLVGIAPTGAPA